MTVKGEVTVLYLHFSMCAVPRVLWNAVGSGGKMHYTNCLDFYKVREKKDTLAILKLAFAKIYIGENY